MPAQAVSKTSQTSDGNEAQSHFRANASNGVSKYKRIVVLTEGESQSEHVKTARGLLHYRSKDILAVLDSECEGHVCKDVFGVGGDTPIVGSLDDTPVADALFVGIAPAGGCLPNSWHPIIATALSYGMDVVSGLHDFVSDLPEFQQLARHYSANIIDVRRSKRNVLARHATFRPGNLRIHTVGQDCCVGKMVVAVEVERRLQQMGHDAKFVATGQTGIMIGGHGVAVDAITSDFVNGAVEELVLALEHHDTLLIEGQGSLAHPSCSGVTLGLLHGCAPHGLIMCYAPGRSTVGDLPFVPLQPLPKLIRLYEDIASTRYPCKVIGIAINAYGLTHEEAMRERNRIQLQTGLPVCDVRKDSADVLAKAIIDFRAQRIR
jgi:uncharacterized NAD-dependent epimerase/dehydratase family protein